MGAVLRDPIRLVLLLLGSTLFGGALMAGLDLIVNPGTQSGSPATAGALAGFGLGLVLAGHTGDA